MRFVLSSSGPRGPGPVDVEVESSSAPATAVALARKSDGADVRVDVVRLASAASPARLRLRWLDSETWDGKPREITLRLLDPAQIEGKAAGGFDLVESEGCQALCLRERMVWRLRAEFDPERFDATFKPYHDLFDPSGRTQITKGLGGTYPHHRGLFVGWNKTVVDGKSLDFWHCREGRHQVRVSGTTSLSSVVADSTDIVEWRDADEHAVVRESRTLSVWDAGDDQRIIDVTVQLSNLGKTTVRLDGDPQHAGCQVRLAEEVSAHQDATRYQRTDGAKDEGNDVWSGCNFACIRATVGDVDTLVLHASHPANPSPFVYSTRAYGRLGSFQAFALEPGEPVTLRYRLAVSTGEHQGICADPSAAAATFAVRIEGVESKIRNGSR